MDKGYWHFFRKTLRWHSTRFDFWFCVGLSVGTALLAAYLEPWMLLLTVVPFGIMLHGIHSITKLEYDFYKETRKEV